jgi:hypothetical protein
MSNGVRAESTGAAKATLPSKAVAKVIVNVFMVVSNQWRIVLTMIRKASSEIILCLNDDADVSDTLSTFGCSQVNPFCPFLASVLRVCPSHLSFALVLRVHPSRTSFAYILHDADASDPCTAVS